MIRRTNHVHPAKRIDINVRRRIVPPCSLGGVADEGNGDPWPRGWVKDFGGQSRAVATTIRSGEPVRQLESLINLDSGENC
jgi:hypothetical protein